MTEQSDIVEPTFSYASAALAGDYDANLAELEERAPVRLISTMHGLTVAFTDEPASAAASRADEHRFDHLPVRNRESGQIVGLFERSVKFLPESVVGAVMRPPANETLISADTPLLRFLYTADISPCRLVLDGMEITGLVTLSDIQRLPVRTVLFGLFIHFEILLTQALRKVIGEDRQPFHLLSHERAKKAEEQWKVFVESGLDRDAYSALLLADKKALAKTVQLGGASKSRIEAEFSAIEKHLRDPIAHGSEYARTREKALATIKAARFLRNWIAVLKRDVQLAEDQDPGRT